MRLASSFDALKPHYEAVVVGSGYGGSIAACRLAAAGVEVCVLEQGKELQPGEYPNTLLEAAAEAQVTMPGIHHFGSRSGMFDFHAGEHVNVFKACALGGTSLINANVSIRPDPRVFTEYSWPLAIREEAGVDDSELWRGYQSALTMLGAKPYPTTPSDIAKLDVLGQSATGMGRQESFSRPHINVTFEDGVSAGGVQQAACTRCGDCMTGCNYGSKNTTLMNYLPDARRHGAWIFTQCAVRWVEPAADGWTVAFHRLDSGDEAFDATPRTITAGTVILAGGSLGSTEILLRSAAQRKLALSAALGKRFSGNGDVLGFAYNVTPIVNGSGWGRTPAGQLPLVGPGITGLIDLRDEQAPLTKGMIIEEGAIAGAISTFMPEIMAYLSRREGIAAGAGPGFLSELESVFLGPHHGALQHTQTYLAMAHDGADGELALGDDDQIQISWPTVPPVFAQINEALYQATKPLGGVFVKNPTDGAPFVKPGTMTTVHPLGGCRMADAAEDGVVNADCQVFDGSTGSAVHDGLYVMDGAVVPWPLGVNPLLTISALAERATARLIASRKPQSPSPGPAALAPAVATGAGFSERWSGNLDGGGEMVLALTVVARDLSALLADPAYRAEVHGSASIAGRLFAVTGSLSAQSGAVSYSLTLTSNGAPISLAARRAVPADPSPEAVAAASALAISSPPDVALGGTLGRAPADWRNELASIRIYSSGTEQAARRGQLTDALARRLAGTLTDVYGAVAARPHAFAPKSAPLKRRTVNAEAPDASYFRTSDGRLLRLLRHRGSGPPILLVHSLGQSSRLYGLTTMQPNVVELLSGLGFDVWLLDDRGSNALPGALDPFNLDQIAGIDIPAALGRVAEARPATPVVLFAHGWGAAAAWMHLLSGQAGDVRAFVASQVGPMVDAGPAFGLAARLHSTALWRALGSQVVGGYAGQTQAGSAAWKLASRRRGGRPAQVVASVYGPVLQEQNISPPVEATIPYLYGPVNAAAADHVQAIARAGRMVDANGADSYLSKAVVPAIPMLLLHGSQNRLSLPSGLDRSLRWLSSRTTVAPTPLLLEGFGHDDSIIGHLAPLKVFPMIATFLERLRQ